MRALLALVAVLGLVALAWLGAGQGYGLGFAVPLTAMVIFVSGFVWRVLSWARIPVPFKITSVAGQQASLPFLRRSPLDSPKNGGEAALRVVLDVLLFRPLFRNTRTKRGARRQPFYEPERLLWAAGLAFHWTLLVVLLRHLRLFFEPPPSFVASLDRADGFFQLATPALLASDIVLVLALLVLVGRRLLERPLRHLSLPADYFVLFLLLGVALSGVFMRHVGKVDLVATKEISLGLVSLRPPVPFPDPGAALFVHLSLVSTLLVYFPASKLMHMGGIFLSPTRNLANDNRRRRHVSPWSPQAAPHTYEEWEDEFRDKLVAAGLPLEKG